MTPDGFVDVADEALVLASLPHETLDTGVPSPHPIGALDELRVRTRRLVDQIAPKKQDADVAVPRNRERLFFRDDRLRRPGQKLAANRLRRKHAREVGKPSRAR